jgi:hypothetical protein
LATVEEIEREGGILALLPLEGVRGTKFPERWPKAG